MDTPNRTFIREGLLDKLCRKGPKPFMFWLFSDRLLYGEVSVNGVVLLVEIFRLIKVWFSFWNGCRARRASTSSTESLI